MSDTLVVAAIDFGTTFSSWGFSFKHEFDLDPTKVTAKQWSGLESTISLKGPTTILIHPDGKTIDSFGFDAETKYAELAEENQHKEWYFFKRFKMLLFDKIGLQRDFTIEDATGKSLKARTVFTLSIKYLKDDLMDMTKRKVLDEHLREDDIKWVLTVPAIWNDVAKQFMREAAEDAGIKAENLAIALEPEVASLYCQHIPTTIIDNSLSKLKPGNRYLILDAGGGTVDITVHEITNNGNLKEIYKANGGDWGGTKVDQAFEDLISEITGTSVMEQFKEDNMDAYLDLMKAFEVKKRETQKGKHVAFKIPVALMNLTEDVTGETIRNTISQSKHQKSIRLSGDKLRLDFDIIYGVFEKSIESIIHHLHKLFENPEVAICDAILMVGGYSESSLLQESIKENFSSKKIIVPTDAGLAVLKGAVIYGHNPALIAQRVCKYTYGNGGVHNYSTNCKHRPARKSFENDIERCNDIFYAHVRAGDIIKLGDECKAKQFYPLEPLQESITFDIYCTKEKNPELVTDTDCVKLGSVTIPMLDTTGGCSRSVDVSFLFGGTEIEVKVRNPREGTVRELKVSFWG
ncbi:heat shock 70 kDa protein 12A-like [Ruditapes philippinarum]|uniref:heat shock 70 kDa protein 12A-like n=1 Tax=Ruditapes philippinarum TaxID=129788 RepID=UPI00295C2776|nr:heat shock 70 kDa protein 12A-like [Ruditapes philippinarum]